MKQEWFDHDSDEMRVAYIGRHRFLHATAVSEG